MSIFENEPAATIARFLAEVGIPMEPATIDEQTFLPGIRVDNGTLLVDEAKLSYPGDLLHEAGHLAVMPSSIRGDLHDDDVTQTDEPEHSVELAAIAWSYAAALHLGIPIDILFHADGYKGQAAGLILSYSLGVYPGVKGLEDIGLTATGELARSLGVDPFPNMLKWVRD